MNKNSESLFSFCIRQTYFLQEDDHYEGRKRRRSSINTIKHVIRAPEDITEQELEMIAKKGTVKKYDQVFVS